jgi:hypothetical protein
VHAALAGPTLSSARPPVCSSGQLTKTADRKTVTIGENITYTLTLTKSGPRRHHGHRLRRLAPWSAEPGLLDLRECLRVLHGREPRKGASVTLTVVATPITNLARTERRVTNCAFIDASGSTDPNPDNDIAYATVRIVEPLNPERLKTITRRAV